MKRKIYAAYGSNINVSQMITRCPNAKVFGRGELRGYKLAFYGRADGFAYATILPCDTESVPVLLWEITSECEQQLDIYEGFPKHYVKEKVVVSINAGKETNCFAYVMNLKLRRRCLPSKSYFDTIIAGYRECEFSEEKLYTALR